MTKHTRFLLVAALFGALANPGALIAADADPASPGNPPGSISGTLPTTRPVTKLEGYLELRPSWVPNDSAMRLENNAYLGARFSNGWLLAYRQEFVNQVTGGEGRTVTAGDGWIEYSAYPALRAGPLTLNAEFHGILPVAEVAKDTNYVFGARTYLEGILQIVPRFGLFSRLMPRANVFRSGPTEAERQRFENQFELGPYVSFFSDKLVVRALVRWTAGSLEAAGDAPRWVHEFRLVPEVRYQLTPAVVLGLGQLSGSMVDEQFGGKADALSGAFRESMWQFIVQVTI